jgi:hypothetical protein
MTKKIMVSQIVMKLNQIEGYGKYHVFYNYSGHVNEFSYRLLSLATDFHNRKDDDTILDCHFYLEEINEEKYCDIMDELNGFI